MYKQQRTHNNILTKTNKITITFNLKKLLKVTKKSSNFLFKNLVFFITTKIKCEHYIKYLIKI